MNKKKTPLSPEDLAAKVDWEGSAIEALMYGLADEDVNNDDPELKEAFEAARDLWLGEFADAITELNARLRRYYN